MAIWGLSISKEEVININCLEGKADLSLLKDYQTADIGGQWEYYDRKLYKDIASASDLQKQYVEVPHLWKGQADYKGYPYGYAVYRTEITGLKPEKYYGVLVVDEAASYRLWVNGKLIIESGKVGKTKEDYTAEMRAHWNVFNTDNTGKADIVIEIANFDYHRGGFWIEPRIGEFDAVRRQASVHNTVDIFLFTAIIIMGLFFFALYGKTKSTKTALIMGFFSVLVAFRIMFTDYRLIGYFVPGIPWTIMNRIEYMLGYILLPVAGYMTCSLGYLKSPKFMKYIYHVLLVIAIALPVFTSDKVYAVYFKYYKGIVVIACIYFTYILVRGIYSRKNGAIPTAIAYAFLIAGTILELFVWNRPFIMGFSTFIMIAIFALVQIVAFYSIKIKKENLESQIIIDKLTSVYNRLYLEQLIAGPKFEEKENYRWYVLFIDLNCFKHINDTYGHHAGDIVLREVAQLLKQVMGINSKVFRYGGDEFVIFTQFEDYKNPRDLEASIHNALEEPLNVEGQKLQVSVSIGITEYKVQSETLYDAILRSDDKMYKIKHCNS